MGFDCTLHAVSEAALGEFAKRLTGTSKRAAPFDRAVKKGKTLFEKVRKSKDGHAVTELALLFASAEGAHVVTRGVALSLWNAKLLGPRPLKLFGSVGRGPLASVVDAFSYLPTAFESNYCTGVFVPSAKVPALARELEKRFARRSKGDTAEWVPLLRVLHVAEKRGLAYWEGTDLEVVDAHPEWIAAERPRAVRQVLRTKGLGGSQTDLRACNGDLAVVADLERYSTWVLDLRVWPPKRRDRAPALSPQRPAHRVA